MEKLAAVVLSEESSPRQRVSAFRTILAAEKHNLNLVDVALAHSREARAQALKEEALAQARAVREEYAKKGSPLEQARTLAAEIANRGPAPEPQSQPGPAKRQDDTTPKAPGAAQIPGSLGVVYAQVSAEGVKDRSAPGEAPGLPGLPKAGEPPSRSLEQALSGRRGMPQL
jgi:hypothetical protein